MKKLSNGRLSVEADSFTDHFHSSISFDSRMYKEDITGSIAHARMLGRQGIIPFKDSQTIISALEAILKDIETGKITFDEKAEDIHMNVETILTERIGDVGKKLHTGRSRNDQVALDIRMYLKNQVTDIRELIYKLLEVINNMAKEHTETIMPGFTHLQNAQPVTFAHHILSYFEMFSRDSDRLADCYKRINVMPLGSGALAATTYNLDREAVCKELDFDSVTRNSMDGVSDRDFVCEVLFCLSLLMMHLSRFCEELVLWSSQQFKFIEISDAYATGSSIMPQKKNPDMAELIRGKTGRVYGELIALLTTLKGLPLAYNKDMQEDKEGVFDAVDTVKMCLPVFINMIKTMKINKENMLASAKLGFMNATDGADWLVKHGVPFRDAHSIMGEIVMYCIEKGKNLEELSLDEYKSFSPVFVESIYDDIDLKSCVNRRTVKGGPSKEYIDRLIAENDKLLKGERFL
ncbi:MAG: argininosuccinate lyase [Clostridiales bacterium]|nr:argininosuccinate lyase [Clostridiales bacterium]